MTSILLIDDDEKLTEPLQYQLTNAGFRVFVAHSGQPGLGLALMEKPDVIVLDIMLPGMDGWTICQEIRRFSQTPIIMLTALGTEVDRVRGLELGADDYLSKPFSFQELIARIKSMLRRLQWDQNAIPDSRLQIGGVMIDLGSQRAFKDNVELVLRRKEFELLSLLMQQAGKTVTREMLFNQVWGTDWLGDTRTLDVHIRWLRQKIEANPSVPLYVQTVRGVGYRFATREEVITWP